MGKAKPEVPRWRRKPPPAAGPVITVKGRGARQIARDLRTTLPPGEQAAKQQGIVARTGAYRFRRHLIPVALLAGITAAGLGCWLPRTGKAEGIGIALGLLCAAALWKLTRHLKGFTRRAGTWMAALTAVWVPVLSAFGSVRPLLVLLFASWLPLMWAWAKHYRWRPDEKKAEPPPQDQEIWDRLAAKRKWTGHLDGFRRLEGGGRQWDIVLDGSQTHIGQVMSDARALAAAWSKSITEAYAEPSPTDNEARGMLTILPRNTLEAPREWNGQGPDPDTGLAVVGRFPDGKPVHERVFVRRNGPRHTIIAGADGSGKALALDTLVPTPKGWTTMGDLKHGDVIYSDTGEPCRVTAAWSIRYERPCYEITFSDGTIITADADHRWLVETHKSRISEGNARRKGSPETRRPYRRLPTSDPAVVTTSDMVSSVRTRHGHANYSIRCSAPLRGRKASLPVPPYTLGAWLGDGHTRGGSITTADPEILTEIEAEGERLWVTPSSVTPTCSSYWIQGLTARLRKIGVVGNKHIPVAYLRASEEQRRALLAGLLDTDGHAAKHGGGVTFAVTNERLARDVLHLVCTLGYKATIRSRPARYYGKDCGTAWTVSFATADKVFRMPRKVARQPGTQRVTVERRYITDIKPVPSVPVRCITVDSPSSLYLVTQACIPTHNTGMIDMGLCISAASGIIAPVILDPQEGQALPAWREHVIYACGAEECLHRIRGLHEALFDRSRYLAGLRWELDGDWRTGMGFFDPFMTGLPIVEITLDEAPALLCHPKFGGEASEKMADFGKLGRKVGFRIRMAIQVPSLAELGNAGQPLRSILVGGNVFCGRTGDKVTQGMINTGADPSELPKYFPDGKPTVGLGYSSGPDNRPSTRSRWDYVPDPYKVARSMKIRGLDERCAEAMDRGMRGSGVQTVIPLSTAPLAAAPDVQPGRSCADAVLAVLHGEMSKSDIMSAANRLAIEEWDRKSGWGVRAFTDALSKLTAGGQIDKTDHGSYASRRASLHSVSASAATRDEVTTG